MKIQHSTTIELSREVDARALKLALEQIPDNAHISTVVHITEPDRPYETRRTSVSLNAVWEAEGAKPAPVKREVPPPSTPLPRYPDGIKR